MEEEKNQTGGDDKIVRIGEFVEDTPGGEMPKMESDVPSSPAQKSPEERKKKAIQFIAHFASIGLPEEDAKKIAGEFEFIEEYVYDFFDMGDHLTETMGVHMGLSKGKSLLLFGGATAGLILFLRPDLREKILHPKKNKKVEPIKTEEEIPPQKTQEAQI